MQGLRGVLVHGMPSYRCLPRPPQVHPLCATCVVLLKRTLAFKSALPVLFGEGGLCGVGQISAAGMHCSP